MQVTEIDVAIAAERETQANAVIRRPPPVTKRRRLVDPTTSEREYTADQLEFMNAMQEYKQSSCRMFPTWSEAHEVLLGLGYRKVV